MSAGNRDADHGGAGRDHLAALFFSPFAGGSHGIYTPGAFDLHLGGGLAMTALTRACMQTPILTFLIESWPEMIGLVRNVATVTP